MKITAYLTADAIQFNLVPETEHERKFMAMLADYRGSVTVSKAAQIGPCQAGYIRDFGLGREDKGTAITIHRAPAEQPPTAE